MPSDAYWTTLDFKSIGAAAVGIGGLAFPFIKDFYKEWRAGRSTDNLSLAKAAETMAERLDRLNREQYENMKADRDYQARRADEAEKAEKEAKEDYAAALASARAMDDWAHFFRHGWAALAQRFRSLVSVFEQMSLGTMAPERGEAVLREIKASLPEPPPGVPLLRNAATERPPS